ncbi:MAG: hypothetical protein HYW78_02920 [Parcubacteria group bacterium]|nr:hypothetical protein [Parcubacteria group bacterium]
MEKIYRFIVAIAFVWLYFILMSTVITQTAVAQKENKLSIGTKGYGIAFFDGVVDTFYFEIVNKTEAEKYKTDDICVGLSGSPLFIDNKFTAILNYGPQRLVRGIIVDGTRFVIIENKKFYIKLQY